MVCAQAAFASARIERIMTRANAISEAEIQRAIQRELAGLQGLCLWRVNVGTGWTGDDPQVTSTGHGRRLVLIQNARPFDTGLPNGFTDLFGVYTGVPVFIEVKSASGRLRPMQAAFILAMKKQGCLAGVARSVEDAKAILAGEL